MTLSSPFQVNSNPVPGRPEPAGQAAGTTVKGFLDGEKVMVRPQGISPCEHALEEATFVMSQREKDLKQRKVKDRRHNKADQAHRVEFFHEKLPDLDRDQLRKFLEQVKNGSRPDELAEAAGRFFKDVSHRYAAMRWAAERLEQGDNADPNLAGALKTAANACLSGNGPDVAAGLNVSRIAHDYAVKGFGELQSLRDLYRETITRSEGLEDTYTAILSKYSHEEIPAAIDFLMGAAGCDLKSQHRSASKAKLKTVMDELYWLKFLSGMHKDCTILVNRMRNQFGLKLRASSGEIMDKLLNVKNDPYPQSAKIVKMVRNLGITDPVVKIDFIRECNNMVSNFPEKSFQDDSIRQNLVLTFRTAMELAIDEEMEMLE